MEKNLQKYGTYRNAFEQIDSAIKAGFFLEAITIEESILTDRLLRICRDQGYSRSYDRATLGHELSFIKDNLKDQLEAYEFAYLYYLEIFWVHRNTCLHQIAKSEPGTPIEGFEDITRRAEQVAVKGKVLINQVRGWAKKYKKRVTNTK